MPFRDPSRAEPSVRVLIVAPAPLGEARIGGIANFIRGFVRHMPPDFAAQIVGVAVGTEDGGRGWRPITFAGRTVEFLPVARIPHARRSGRIPAKLRIVIGMLRQRRLIRARDSVAQVHAPAMDLGLLGRGVPTIRFVHNAPADLATNRGESSWRRLGRGLHLFERLTFGRADLVYFVNRATYEEYTRRMPAAAARMRYLPNFVDTATFFPRQGDARRATRQALARDLGIADELPWILWAGRLDPQKDPALALRSFAAAESRAMLLMAGEGHLHDAARALATELGIGDRVAFTGTLAHERLAELMGVADAFLLTSDFEAGPTVVYEALAAGLPVVSTPVGEVPNLVRHQETGWLGEANAASLAGGLRWALGLDRESAAAACAASMAPYHLETVLAPLYAEHRRLVGTPASGEPAVS